MINKATPIVVVDADVPAIADGKPVMPRLWTKSSSYPTIKVGPKDIHTMPDPDPVWNPSSSGWYTPPPPVVAPYQAIWTVRNLPDPSSFHNGYYWLGDPSSADGTSGISSACRQWYPSPGTAWAPAWRSFFPFKPSVRAYDAYLPGGTVVHHPKGVHFNSQFIEHMWADFGRDHPQPYTWVIAAMIVNFPSPSYKHYMLDSGRNPDVVHFPRISASQCSTPRTIKDNLGDRQLLAVTPTYTQIGSDFNSARQGYAKVATGIRPKMYAAVFNGGSSYVGVYSPGKTVLQKSVVDNSSLHHGRYYVMGRANGHISQDAACHMLVFEMRYFGKAMSGTELQAQYNQLSATYKFNEYRAL